MKKVISLIILTIACTGAAMAQFADPYMDINMNPSTLGLGASGKVDISVGNAGNTDIVTNSLQITLTMTTNATITGLDATSTAGWTVFSVTAGNGNTIKIRNTGATLASFTDATLHLSVTATNLGGPSNIVANVAYYTIIGGNPALGGAPSSSQGNVVGNDGGQSALTVSAVVAVRLNDITAEPSDCSAKLKWSTAQEEAGTGYEIEYSADGRNFVKVANVAGRQIPSGAAYEYSYNQGNGKGYYRLKIIGVDGQSSYSKVVNTNIKCNAKKIFIYPNPIKTDEILHVNISNFDGKITGELLSAEGKKVLTRTLQNGSNLVTLTSLPQGNYNFKVTDDKGEMQNYKVVIVK
jgi:hypothetical protein